MGKNIVIGGTGFIGSPFAKALHDRGEEVISVSRSGKGDIPGIRYEASDAAETDKLAPFIAEGNNIFILTGQVYQNFDAQKELTDLTNLVFQQLNFQI